MVVQERLKLLEATQPAPATLFLLEKADGRLSLDDLLSRSPEPLETTWRALYGLILLDVLRPEIAQTKAADDNTVTRTEMEARLKSADGADYYAILEVNATATTAQIRSAYYFLARRYHPDRFRTGPLRDLLGETEIYFSCVTEAYNTLFDAALRTAYDEQRASAAPESRRPQQDAAYLAKQNFARARILIDKGRLTDAVTSLQNAIEQDSQQATYHLALGRLLTRNPRMRTQAEEHLITTNRIDPALTDGYVALGELYLKKNRNADAVKLFREALRWEPGHIDATTHLKELGERVEA